MRDHRLCFTNPPSCNHPSDTSFYCPLDIHYSNNSTFQSGPFLQWESLGPTHSWAFDLSYMSSTEGLLHNAENSGTYKNDSFDLAMKRFPAPAPLCQTTIGAKLRYTRIATWTNGMSAMDIDEHSSTDLQGRYAWTNTLRGIYYGPGSIKTALPKLLTELGITKALIVTGKSLHDKVSLMLWSDIVCHSCRRSSSCQNRPI